MQEIVRRVLKLRVAPIIKPIHGEEVLSNHILAARKSLTGIAVLALTLGCLSWASSAPYRSDRDAMIDNTTVPGDDFFRYATGAWMDRTIIPEDRPGVSMPIILTDRTQNQLRIMLEDFAHDDGAGPHGIAVKIGAFYSSFMNDTVIEKLGVRPVAADLSAIKEAESKAAIARLMGQTNVGFTGSFFTPSIDIDRKANTRYTVTIPQSGLSMPDRSYYLEASLKPTKAALLDYVEGMLALAGWPNPEANAQAVVALETKIAAASWTKTAQRDWRRLYNPLTVTDLVKQSPGFPWQQFLDGAGLDRVDRVIVAEDSAIKDIADVFRDERIPVLQAWLAFTVLDRASPYLSSQFQQANFKFRQHTLTGQSEPSPRWQRGILAVSGGDCAVSELSCFGTMNWAGGDAYVARHFSPATKRRVEKIAMEVKQAFRNRIETLDWMSAATKTEALKKLDTYTIKVGYPDHKRDYSKLIIRRDDLVGNVRRAAALEWRFKLDRRFAPVERGDWIMTPQTVDAYNGSLSDIVFPAAILQAPVFDADGEPAANYAAVGATIGHELTHGFDDQGRMIDARGELRDWWLPQDAAAFRTRAARLGEQYARYEPIVGLRINPELTMGENIADLGGIELGLDAYHAALRRGHLSAASRRAADRRYFVAVAQVFRAKFKPDYIRQLTLSDTHSYRKFRVNGSVRNLDAWYAAFAVQPAQKLYLKPTERVRIW